MTLESGHLITGMEATKISAYTCSDLKNCEGFGEGDDDEEEEDDVRPSTKYLPVIARKPGRVSICINGRPTRVRRNVQEEEIELIDLTSDKEEDQIDQPGNRTTFQSWCQPLQQSDPKPAITFGSWPWRKSNAVAVCSTDEECTPMSITNADSLVENMLLFDGESVVLESEPTFPSVTHRIYGRKRRKRKRHRHRYRQLSISHPDKNFSDSDSDSKVPSKSFTRFKRTRRKEVEASSSAFAPPLSECDIVSEEIRIFQPVIRLQRIDDILENGGTVKLLPNICKREHVNGVIKSSSSRKLNITPTKDKDHSALQTLAQEMPVTATRYGRISKRTELHPGYVEHTFDSDDSF